MLLKVQWDSKPFLAADAKSCSPGIFPWKSSHTSCTMGYSMVGVQQGKHLRVKAAKDFIRGFKEAEKVGGEETSGLYHY